MDRSERDADSRKVERLKREIAGVEARAARVKSPPQESRWWATLLERLSGRLRPSGRPL